MQDCGDAGVLRALVRRQDRKLDPKLRHHLQALQIDGGFRQPHPFRQAFKARLEVSDAPIDLRVAIMVVRQWQNHVVISLGDPGSMPGEAFPAESVGVQDRVIDLGFLSLHP